MTIREIKNIQEKSFLNIKNDKYASEYSNAIADFLEKEKVTDEVISVLIKGMDLDHGVNFSDYLEGLSSQEVQKLWKIIKNNTDMKENINNNALKFAANVLYLGLINNGNSRYIMGEILSCITSMIESEENPVSSEEYGPILMDYVFKELTSRFEYPQWKDMRTSEEVILRFAEQMQRILHPANESLNFKILKWLERGKKYAEEKKARKTIEDKIPKSKINELNAITEHYQKVEEQLRNSIYEINNLERNIEKLKQDKCLIREEKKKLERNIKLLNKTINEQKQRIINIEEEVQERKKINDASDALNKNNKEAMLRDIANALSAEYKDFIESERDEMDLQLGEIYREKLKNIFKILSNKGIRME